MQPGSAQIWATTAIFLSVKFVEIAIFPLRHAQQPMGGWTLPAFRATALGGMPSSGAPRPDSSLPTAPMVAHGHPDLIPSLAPSQAGLRGCAGHSPGLSLPTWPAGLIVPLVSLQLCFPAVSHTHTHTHICPFFHLSPPGAREVGDTLSSVASQNPSSPEAHALHTHPPFLYPRALLLSPLVCRRFCLLHFPSQLPTFNIRLQENAPTILTWASGLPCPPASATSVPTPRFWVSPTPTSPLESEVQTPHSHHSCCFPADLVRRLLGSHSPACEPTSLLTALPMPQILGPGFGQSPRQTQTWTDEDPPRCAAPKEGAPGLQQVGLASS